MNDILVDLVPWACFVKIGCHLGFRTLWNFTAKYMLQDYFFHDNDNLRYRSTYCYGLFGIFFLFGGRYFKYCSGREVHHKPFHVDIIDSYSILSQRCSVMKTSWYSQYFPHCWLPVGLPYRLPLIAPLLLVRISSVVNPNIFLANSWVVGDLRRHGFHVASLQWQVLEPFRVTPIPSSTNGTTSDNSWSVLRIRVTFDNASKCVICTNLMYKKGLHLFVHVLPTDDYGILFMTYSKQVFSSRDMI